MFFSLHKRPALSIIVVAYKMPRQLANTLYTLGSEYQQKVDGLNYEVIILENRSSENLATDIVERLPPNFRYYLRDESSVSPAAAMNEGLRLARGDAIGMMIDGAHMLSPGVLRYAAMAFRMASDAFVTVPVYHLGPKEQNESSAEGYNEQVEKELLKTVDWRVDGYELFTISTLCSANPRGFLGPIMESNCYFASREAFDAIGGVDEEFTLPGGGSLNLHLTRQLGMRNGSEYFMLGGEGTFHQFHGGVTSSENRARVVEDHSAQLHMKWGGDYKFLRRNPIILGHFREQVHPALKFSVDGIKRRVSICRRESRAIWPDDV